MLLGGATAKGGAGCSNPELIKAPEGISQRSPVRFRSSLQMSACNERIKEVSRDGKHLRRLC